MVTLALSDGALSQQVKRIIKEGQPFRDSDFPANSQSLLDTANENGGIDSKTVRYFESVEWRRLSDIYAEQDGGMQLFKQPV